VSGFPCGNNPHLQLTPSDRVAVNNYRDYLTARTGEKETVTNLDDARAALKPHEIDSGFVGRLEAFETAVRANERAGAEARRLGAPDFDPAATRTAIAEAFRDLFGNGLTVLGRDGDWANVADFIATGARIPACGAFYPSATDTRCYLAKGHRRNHLAKWGTRDMAWPYDPRETQPPFTAEELAAAQADVDHLNTEFPDDEQAPVEDPK
jgi:hypothetical protein